MSSLGSHLRELRERRAVSLEEISRVTRVPRSYLEALETGEMSALPAPVFVRGFIRAYCQVLGEPPAEALSHYDNRDGTTGEPDTAQTDTVGRRASGRSQRQGTVLVSLVLLVVLGVALFAVTLALQSGRDESGRPAPSTVAGRSAENAVSGEAAQTAPVGAVLAAPAPAEPSTAAATAPAATAPAAGVPQAPPVGSAPAPPASARAGTPAAPTPGVSATTPSPGAPSAPARAGDAATAPDAGTSRARDAERLVASATSPYRLIARTSEATWVRVRTEDGQHLSEETIPAGQVREWVSNRRFEVTVGNAGGVKLELNGQTLPSLGSSREVVKLALPPQAP